MTGRGLRWPGAAPAVAVPSGRTGPARWPLGSRAPKASSRPGGDRFPGVRARVRRGALASPAPRLLSRREHSPRLDPRRCRRALAPSPSCPPRSTCVQSLRLLASATAAGTAILMNDVHADRPSGAERQLQDSGRAGQIQRPHKPRQGLHRPGSDPITERRKNVTKASGHPHTTPLYPPRVPA